MADTPTPPAADAAPSSVTLNEHAKALADEHELDVAALVADEQITATGANGDVLKGDVQKYLDAVAEAEAAEKAEAEAAEKAAGSGEPDGIGSYRVTGNRPVSTVVAGSNRLLHLGTAYALPSADPAVRALVKAGDLAES